MAGLVDIGPLSKEVAIRGTPLVLYGISGLALFHMLANHSEIRKLFSGSGVEVTPEMLLAQAPDAVADAIVLAAKTPADERAKAKDIFLELPLGEQMEIIRTIWDLTFPKGVASFLATLEELGKVTGSGWGPVTVSPGPLSSLSPKDIPSTLPGATPPE